MTNPESSVRQRVLALAWPAVLEQLLNMSVGNAYWLGPRLALTGIWLAIGIDFIGRAVLLTLRFRSGKWKYVKCEGDSPIDLPQFRRVWLGIQVTQQKGQGLDQVAGSGGFHQRG